MAIDTVGVPIGGGLGNKKVMLVDITGTYETNGFVVPGVTQEPTLFLVSGGANVVFLSGKFKIMMPTYDASGTNPVVANAEIANGTSVAIKGIIVF